MIFSPSTGAYKQVGGFKAILISFQVLGAGKRSGLSQLYYQLCLGNEPITYSSTRWRSCYVLLYEIISGKKPSDKFLENAQMVGFVLLISLLLFANGRYLQSNCRK
jgi:regulator of sigma E protease